MASSCLRCCCFDKCLAFHSMCANCSDPGCLCKRAGQKSLRRQTLARNQRPGLGEVGAGPRLPAGCCHPTDKAFVSPSQASRDRQDFSLGLRRQVGRHAGLLSSSPACHLAQGVCAQGPSAGSTLVPLWGGPLCWKCLFPSRTVVLPELRKARGGRLQLPPGG